MMVSYSDLRHAERSLRQYDKALRLRFAMEQPATVLVERKTRRGRIGALGPDGLEWSPDIGYRYEWGHMPVASVPAAGFDQQDLLAALKAADTWQRWDQHARPRWRTVEERDERMRERRRQSRQADLRYKASEFFDTYAWKHRMRVRVPEAIQ
jgi:hypothetical protein